MKNSMNRRNFVTLGTAAVCGLSAAGFAGESAEAASAAKSQAVKEGARISLPAPQKSGGMPLFEALAKRKTTRAFQKKMLDLQTLSNLLWAAAGINRDDGRRTSPTALNSQEILIYVMLENGVYRYEPAAHSLERHAEGNFQKLAGLQTYAQSVPVTLLYVADLNLSNASPDEQDPYSRVDCGFIGQNVYLFAAACGLACVFRGSLDRKGLAEMLNLKEKQFVHYAQSVGYPDEERAMAAPIKLLK